MLDITTEEQNAEVIFSEGLWKRSGRVKTRTAKTFLTASGRTRFIAAKEDTPSSREPGAGPTASQLAARQKWRGDKEKSPTPAGGRNGASGMPGATRTPDLWFRRLAPE